MPEEKSIRIDLFRCKDILLRRKIPIILVAFLFFAGAFMVTREGVPNLYSSTATVYSVVKPGTDLFQAQYANMLLRGYTEVATSARVLQTAADKLGMAGITARDLQKIIRVHSSEASAVISIEAVSENPALAISAANAVAGVFVMEISEITGQDAVRHLDTAAEYERVQNGFILAQGMRAAAGIGGAFLACAAILTKDIFFSGTIHSLPDATFNGSLEILAMVPTIGKRKEQLDERDQDDL